MTKAPTRRLRFEFLEQREVLSSYGLIAPIGPQPGVAAPAGAIVLSASSGRSTNQAILDGAPANSTFYFQAGTYTDLTIDALPGDRFIGQYGAILTSTWQTHAFVGINGTSSQRITVENLTIDGYRPPYQQSAIAADDYWRIDHVEVRNSATGGVQIGSHSALTNSYVHDNGQLGVEAYSTDDGCESVLFFNDRVSHNNPANAYDFQVEAGGSKFWNVTGLTVTYCEFDNNVGDGIWMDGNLAGGGNTGAIIKNNWTHDNGRYGIFQEIGGSACITNNLVENNGITGLRNRDGTDALGAGIALDNSESVWIYQNVITGNYNGILLESYMRSDTTHRIRNEIITRNVVTMSQGITGVVGDMSLLGSLVFDYNAYDFSGSAAFAWAESWGYTWQQWRTAGFDLHGTIAT